MTQLDFKLMWTLFVIACALPALIGVLVAALVARKVVQRLLPPFPEYIAVQNIHVRSTIQSHAGHAEHVLSSSAAEISSFHVERWLDARGLVMTPKSVAGLSAKAKV